MKNLRAALMMAASLVGVTPTLLQAHEIDEPIAASDWNNGGQTYQMFDQEYQHIWQGIQHGVSDGSYNRRQAAMFYRQMQQIRNQALWEQRRGNYDPEEIQARLTSLHDRMHMAHERGHERMDRYQSYGQSYGQPYGGDYQGGYRSGDGYYQSGDGYNQRPADGYQYQPHF